MNEYLIAIYGWVLFNIIYLGAAKDEKDDQRKPFNFKIWWKYAWDNVLVTFVAIPAVVWFNPILWEWIINGALKMELKYDEAALMGSVPFVQFVYWVIKKFKK